MITSLSRILKFGWQNFRRNGWLSAATISILLITLIVFQGLIIFRVVAIMGIETLKNKVDISIYFVPEAAEKDILTIQQKLEKLESIKKVEYIAREKALTIFKERHRDDPTITQALKELEDNPLSASLNIKAYNPDQYQEIARYVDRQTDWQKDIEKLTYYQNKIVIERLGNIIDTAEKFGLALTIFLSFAAILITFNTISLAIYSSREELSIMRLVGSPNQFIVGPYIITGIIYSVLAAVLSMLIIWPIIISASPYLKFFIEDTSLIDYFYNNFWKLFAYQLLFGIALGIISGKIAIQKYLKI